MGQRASNTAGVTFEDVVIPQEVCMCVCMCVLYECVLCECVCVCVYVCVLSSQAHGANVILPITWSYGTAVLLPKTVIINNQCATSTL